MDIDHLCHNGLYENYKILSLFINIYLWTSVWQCKFHEIPVLTTDVCRCRDLNTQLSRYKMNTHTARFIAQIKPGW